MAFPSATGETFVIITSRGASADVPPGTFTLVSVFDSMLLFGSGFSPLVNFWMSTSMPLVCTCTFSPGFEPDPLACFKSSVDFSTTLSILVFESKPPPLIELMISSSPDFVSALSFPSELDISPFSSPLRSSPSLFFAVAPPPLTLTCAVESSRTDMRSDLHSSLSSSSRAAFSFSSFPSSTARSCWAVKIHNFPPRKRQSFSGSSLAKSVFPSTTFSAISISFLALKTFRSRAFLFFFFDSCRGAGGCGMGATGGADEASLTGVFEGEPRIAATKSGRKEDGCCALAA
mmetsp:Transcript_114129/g.329682  ORF Transcript_114129/g.329682 Transcript_114129/m.329682 type:complete len:289 (-) Transcript_114129:704-1570(-)